MEQKVEKAAADLTLVNTKLAQELAGRVVAESELTDIKAELAEVRVDLLKSQIKEAAAQKVALQDALTGLPNRVLFEQGLDHGLIQAKRHGWGLAVLFIDIDEFKAINDAYGHDAGDHVLLTVASRLQTSVRGEDRVSRWGGDEFVCLLLEVKQAADITCLAQKMIDLIAAPCEFNENVFSVKASVGAALYPADGETGHILLKNADIAMYAAKRAQQGVMLFHAADRSKAS